jgi:hypothetical protein
LAKKTARKKYVVPPEKFKKDFDEARSTVKALELGLKRLNKQLEALCHNPMIPVPKPPPPPPPTTKK